MQSFLNRMAGVFSRHKASKEERGRLQAEKLVAVAAGLQEQLPDSSRSHSDARQLSTKPKTRCRSRSRQRRKSARQSAKAARKVTRRRAA